MTLSSDLKEFLELLNSARVEFVIVGAHSLAFHARPRYTGDLDILVGNDEENAKRILGVLEQFGFAGQFELRDFTESDHVIQLGRAPHRIDLLTSISGVMNEEAFATRAAAILDGIAVHVLSKEALIRNKRATARPQDLADLDLLES
ncbi:MAG: nucleotidyltransferase [Verrucomicrobiota bacterium]|nr:nucleotidyltransferase [Verrucomicrobiota bacterium]